VGNAKDEAWKAWEIATVIKSAALVGFIFFYVAVAKTVVGDDVKKCADQSQ
jgi:hypothetical protein